MRKKRLLAALLLSAFCLALVGCGSLFDREYLSVTDYEFPPQKSSEEEDSITVRDVEELRQVLVSLLNEQAVEGRVVFDPSYAGDVNADIASVCWQVRTQDALFAYCVANISYDVTKLVSHYEARFTIGYTEAGQKLDSIVRLQLTTGLEDQLRQAIARGDGRLVVLIGRSSLTAEDVAKLASRVYREDPIAEPREPRVSINMLSGTGLQRLYDIRFSYSLSAEELALRRQQLRQLDPFGDQLPLPTEPAERALLACKYLLQYSGYSETGQNDIYSALVAGEANSEGLALAYVELCRQLDIPCQIVYGTRNFRSCCWNIIQLDGDYYHVDVSACMTQGMEQGFLLPDETMWTLCRWDISSYPPCSGELRYEDLRPTPEGIVVIGEGEEGQEGETPEEGGEGEITEPPAGEP